MKHLILILLILNWKLLLPTSMLLSAPSYSPSLLLLVINYTLFQDYISNLDFFFILLGFYYLYLSTFWHPLSSLFNLLIFLILLHNQFKSNKHSKNNTLLSLNQSINKPLTTSSIQLVIKLISSIQKTIPKHLINGLNQISSLN